MSKRSNVIFGKQGEKAALEFFQNKGYKLLHKNWRHRKSEIDLIVKKHNKIVFVEVKTRHNTINQTVNEMVSISQQNRIMNAAHNYINTYCLDEEIRFDLIQITLCNNSPNFNHYKGFMYPTLQ
ncbi:MAG: YraN family protein [Crocinitomicaceae bacterium]|nr:YraN family protein [Crocinitomicaceae bacterium]